MHSHAEHGNEGFGAWFTKIKYYDKMMFEARAFAPSWFVND